ncbi:MAG TPA: hypothetical protein VHB27_07670, partial [Rhodopila sp.]|nr:hypothetical protein [Rhodopila sp.]
SPSVSLASGGNIAESGNGIIVADQLTLAATGLIDLGGNNQVSELLSSTAGGAFGFNDVMPNLMVPVGNTVQAGGELALVNSQDLTIDGTATGTATVLRSNDGTLTVNGHSAIARTGALILSGPIVITDGLISAASAILVDANSATLGGEAQGLVLDVVAPTIAFNALDAHTMQVLLFFSDTGTATGSLAAAGLQVLGGTNAVLTGSIAGIGTDAAAAIGVRATAQGTPLGDPPPNANNFTFNGCPIGVAVCHPVTPPPAPPAPPSPPPAPPPLVNLVTTVLPPIGVANSPSTLLRENDPRRFDRTLTPNVLTTPTPPTIGLSTRPTRDPAENLELAPPNVRSEDF